MDPCYYPRVYNCRQEPCNYGYECCSQESPAGDPVFGLCVKAGTCDRKRGICNSKNGRKAQIIEYDDYKQVWAKEGYCNDNNNHTVAIGAMVGIIVLAVLVAIARK